MRTLPLASTLGAGVYETQTRDTAISTDERPKRDKAREIKELGGITCTGYADRCSTYSNTYASLSAYESMAWNLFLLSQLVIGVSITMSAILKMASATLGQVLVDRVARMDRHA
jgi:hypothetical protein